MTPRGIRNNNPGNIIQSSIPWQGKETPSRDPRFESFKTPEDGLRALAKLLVSYEDKYGLRTVRGIINRWAPPVENNTSAYVVAVAKAVGVAPDATISTHDPATLSRLTLGIVQHENGQQPYTPAQIAAAVASALGKPAPKTEVTQIASNDPSSASLRKSMDPLTLVSTLAAVFGPMLRAKIDKAVGSEVGGPLADKLIALAKQETGKADDMEAVAVAKQNPAIVAKLAVAAEDWLTQMAPALDKIEQYERNAFADSEASKVAAGEMGLKMQEAGLWNNPQFLMAAFIMAMVAGVVFTVLLKGTFSTDMQSFVIGAIVGGALTAVISFFFGTSRSSAAKDVVISKLAETRSQE